MLFILQELGLYKAQTKLPFNAFGTMAMARDVRFTSSTWLRPTFMLYAHSDKSDGFQKIYSVFSHLTGV